MTEIAGETIQRVFTVIDPERLVQPALERAEWIAARNGAVLHLYCCIGEQGVAADDPRAVFAVERTAGWLKRLAAPAGEYDLKSEIEVEWDANWRERLAEAARRCNADLIIKTVSRHSRLHRQLRATADWTLLENAHCPTLLIDPSRPLRPRRVLAAVKLNPYSQTYTVLNEKVVALGHRVAEALDGELHAATVYKGEEMYFDRQKFADSCRLPRNQVHSVEGSPHKGIAKIAAETKSDILVIGCAQSSEGGALIGDTAQRIIDDVDLDIIVVPGA